MLAMAGLVACAGAIGIVVVGVLIVRLREGPIFFDLRSQVVSALDARIGHGYHFNLDGTAIGMSDHGPALTFYALSVKDADARPIVSAPSAAIAVDPLALVVGRVAPTRLDVRGVDLRLVVRPDGQVAISAGSDAAAVPLAHAFAFDLVPVAERPPGAAGTGPPPGSSALRALSAAMRSLVDLAAAPDSPLTALQRVDVSGRLVLDDQLHGTTTVFRAAELEFSHAAEGAPTLSVAADGPAGRWALSARATLAEDGIKMLDVSAEGLSLDEITLASGFRRTGFDLPVSAHVALRIGAGGEVAQAAGSFRIGTDRPGSRDPNPEPKLINLATGDFHLDGGAGALLLDRAEVRGAHGSLTLSGRVALPRAPSEPWAATLDASGMFGPADAGAQPVAVDHLGLSFRYWPADDHLMLDRAVATGPELDASARADIRTRPNGLAIRGVSGVRHVSAATLVRLWPDSVGTETRTWLLASLRGGTADATATVDLDGADFAAIEADRPVADGHLRVDFDVSALSLVLTGGLPPLTDVAGTGTATDRELTMRLSRGTLEVSPGRRLSLADGSVVRVPYGEAQPKPGTLEVHVKGEIDALVELLRRDALKSYADLPLDPGMVRGRLDAQVGVAFLVNRSKAPEGEAVTVAATVTNLVVEKLVGNEGLTEATLRLDLDSRSGIHARGDGRIFGAPVAMRFDKAASSPGQATVLLTLDDAARSRAGMAAPELKGPVTAEISATLAPGVKTRTTLALDFTHSKIDTLVPGLSKPSGEQARATATVSPRDSGITLEDLSYAGNGVVVRGSVDLDRDGNLVSATLPQVRLSPGDEMRVDARRDDGVLKVVARATDLDARLFLRRMWAPDFEAGKGAVDLELRSATVMGRNGTNLTEADLHVSLRNGELELLTFTGRLGREPLTIGTVRTDGEPHLSIHAGDAGACLSFVDLYKRMAGGRLDVDMTMRGQRVRGHATIQDFTMRGVAATRESAVESRTDGTRDGLIGAPADQTLGSASAMSFRKLEARFTTSGDVVQVRDGSISGPAFTATTSGTVDLGHDQLSLGGTITPVLGSGSAFSQLSFLGSLLGGERSGGEPKLSYKVTGSAANPALTIDPWSILTPGSSR